MNSIRAGLGELNPLEGLNNWLVEKNRDLKKYKTFGLRPGCKVLYMAIVMQ
jgi:hypothetical protein